MESRRSRAWSALCVAQLGCATVVAWAAPDAVPWERWRAHDAKSHATVDHSTWTDWLGRYVVPGSDGVHRVGYAAVRDADRRALDGYLERLQATPISRLRRAEQLAFWINLYNALTIQVVLDAYPVPSIRRISSGPLPTGPWGRKRIEVEGERLSLDDIEHRILRPLWKDPRLHYALNCASIGCPNLAREAFSADNLEQLLEEGARTYVNHRRAVAVERDRLTVSSIYVWFRGDFGGTAGVLAHLRRYADPELAAQLAPLTAIDTHVYDWSLNDAGPRARRSTSPASRENSSRSSDTAVHRCRKGGTAPPRSPSYR
jgi:hypothetical protein